jgi:hypothetical protein
MLPGDARAPLVPVMPVSIAPVPTEPVKMKSRLDIRCIDISVHPLFHTIFIMNLSKDPHILRAHQGIYPLHFIPRPFTGKCGKLISIATWHIRGFYVVDK